MHSVAWRVVGVVSVLLLLVGCVSSEEQESADHLSVSYSSPFDLPLEDYMMDMVPYGAAIEMVMAQCMEDRGQAYAARNYDLSLSEPEVYSRLGYHRLTPQVAAEFGYGQPADPRILGRAADTPGSNVRESKRYQNATGDCIKESVRLIPDYAPIGNAVLAFDRKSRSTAEETSEVVAAEGVWRRCVQRAVGSDFPSEQLKSEYGPGWVPEDLREYVLRAENTDDDISDPPNAREVVFAVADARCRQSSGWNASYFAVIGRMQQDVIEANHAELADLERKTNELESLVLESLEGASDS